MSAFRFDDDESFNKNCEKFLEALKSEDADLASILEENWSTLTRIVGDSQRNTGIRKEFNASVALSLDKLIDISHPGDNE